MLELVSTGSIPTEGTSERKKRRSRAKPKPEMDLAAEESFKARDLQIMETSYVDQVPLEATETCIFKGEFFDQEKRKVGVVVLPDSFFALHQIPSLPSTRPNLTCRSSDWSAWMGILG